MAAPKAKGTGRTLTLAQAKGKPVMPGDVIVGASGDDGWAVLQPHTASGSYPTGYSDDNVHYSVGPSSTGGGGDTRLSWADGTYGGATGSASGGVSGQATTGAGNVGAGSGSPSKGY